MINRREAVQALSVLSTRFLLDWDDNSVSISNPGTDWRMFQKDLANTGSIRVDSIGEELEEEWVISYEEPIRSSPVVVSGQAISVTTKGTIFSIDIKSGEENWKVDLQGEVIASPAAVDRIVCIPIREGGNSSGSPDASTIIGLDYSNGEQIWRKTIDNDIWASPSVKDEEIYVIDIQGKLYKINSRNGDLVGNWEFNSIQVHSPAIEGDDIFVENNIGYIQSLDTSNEMNWSKGQEGPSHPPPSPGSSITDAAISESAPIESPVTISDDMVISTAMSSTVMARNKNSGEEMWEFSTFGDVLSSPSISGGSIFLGDSQGNVFSVNLKTGDEQWQVDLSSGVRSSPIVINDKLIVCNSREIYQLDTDDGSRFDSIDLGSRIFSTPAVYRNYILIGTDNGELRGIKFAAIDEDDTVDEQGTTENRTHDSTSDSQNESDTSKNDGDPSISDTFGNIIDQAMDVGAISRVSSILGFLVGVIGTAMTYIIYKGKKDD